MLYFIVYEGEEQEEIEETSNPEESPEASPEATADSGGELAGGEVTPEPSQAPAEETAVPASDPVSIDYTEVLESIQESLEFVQTVNYACLILLSVFVLFYVLYKIFGGISK